MSGRVALVGVALLVAAGVVIARSIPEYHDDVRSGGGGKSLPSKPTSPPEGTGFEATGAAPDRLRFAVIGDFGSGTSAEYDVTRRMCRRHDNLPFPLVITTGDNVYPDGDPALFDTAFFEPFDCLFDRGVEVRASLGNHDVATDNGRPELDEPAFGMTARHYVVRRNGVRFVLVDSNNLNRDRLARLLTTEDGDRWTVVAFHHPVYSSGVQHGSTPGFRPGLPRLFQRKGVDLVLNGHDHIYFVSRPLRGIRYVVTGGGGAGLYDCETRWFTDVCRAVHHFLVVVAGQERITVKAFGTTGPSFDGFTTSGR